MLPGNDGGAIAFANSSGSLIDSVLDGNNGLTGNYYGAALSVEGSTVTVSNSTISNNTNSAGLAGGGGIWVVNYYGAVDLTVTNTTISGNSSNNRGGGISHSDYGNGAEISLVNVTLVNNTSDVSGGGLSNDGANITISQSIISGNTVSGVQIRYSHKPLTRQWYLLMN